MLEILHELNSFKLRDKANDIIANASYSFATGVNGDLLILFHDDFVREDYRNQGIYKCLFEARLAFIKATFKLCIVEAYCNKNSLHTYLKHNFIKDEDVTLVRLTI